MNSSVKDAVLSLEDQLEEDIAPFYDNPYGFVMYAYPWGEKGTYLEDETGPDEWQTQVLKDLGHALKHGWVMNNGIKKDCSAGVYLAVASGHGIGKSALMAMLDQWFMSTHKNPALVTTANTKEQLTSKTGREMAKWHKMLINEHWFEKTATKFSCLADPALWFSSLIPWSENKPEAFAGTHEKWVMLKYDEASAIPDIIWETSEGAMTESKGIKIWIVFGNPTQNTGRFRDCFGKHREFWLTYQVDSRTSARTDKELIAKWAKMYGDDSDFFRIRVKGEFPRASAAQFIPGDIVDEAMGKIYHPSNYMHHPLIFSVDIARFGDDKTTFTRRRGLQAYGLKKFRGLDAMRCAGLIAEEIKKIKPDVTFIDNGGIGGPVIDILTSWGYVITPVDYGDPAANSDLYFNKRVEMWGNMRDWLASGGAIPDDSELRDDLIGPEYGFSSKEQYQLESKKDMKSRGLDSPDCGDGLAQTFAHPVPVKTPRLGMAKTEDRARTEYDVLAGGGTAERSTTEFNVFE